MKAVRDQSVDAACRDELSAPALTAEGDLSSNDCVQLSDHKIDCRNSKKLQCLRDGILSSSAAVSRLCNV